MSTLVRASNEWASRPADERFDSIEAMHAFCSQERALAGTASIEDKTMRAHAADDGSLVLNGRTSQARLTNWSFGQLARRAEAPAGYLATLPAKLAAECINTGLDKSADKSRLLIRRSEGVTQNADGSMNVDKMPTIRAITSEKYDRIWNSDITSRLVALKETGNWNEAPAAFDGSRGQYASDRDMFSFFVDNKRRIFERANGGFSRGFFTWNSEVGSSVFGLATFLYQYICGNHMVWGASDVKELRIRHVGDAAGKAFGQLRGKLIAYANSSAADDEMKIQSAMDYELGSNKDEILDRVLGLKALGLTNKTAALAYDTAVSHEDWYGNPRSAFGYSSGLTQIARDMPNTDGRVAIERAASKIMEMAF